MEPKRMGRDTIQNIAAEAVKDAVDFQESELSDVRTKSQEYYDGQSRLPYEKGRSKVVATKVSDTVRSVKPSLMRVFLSTSNVGEYLPVGKHGQVSPQDVALAEQATAYFTHTFWESDGYRILMDVFQDALVKRYGITKSWYEDTYESVIHDFTGLLPVQVQALQMAEGVQILRAMQLEDGTADVTIERRTVNGCIKIDSIPPEDFFFNREARRLCDAYVCGERTEMRVGDLVQMGFDFDEVSDLDSAYDNDTIKEQEEQARRRYPFSTENDDENAADPSMKKVTVTEAYMKIDVDGTGVPALHRLIMGGSAYRLLDYQPVDQIPYSLWEVDPEPHTVVGRSLADITMNDQDAMTSMLRGILDNVQMTNTPRMEALQGQVNINDLVNNEIGAIVRVTQTGAARPLEVPFTAGQTLPALQYMEDKVEQRTGVTRASMGLNADALQSTTKSAADNTIAAAAGQVEVMARNLAEGGFCDMMKKMLYLFVMHADGSEMMRSNGQMQPVDPRVWNVDMKVRPNVGLGTGREDEKQAAYRDTLGLQMQIYQTYGPGNPLVSLTQIRHTLADLMATSGIRNSERYFKPITPEIEQQMMQQAQQAAQQATQGQGDPSQAILQAEAMKVQQKAQTDMVKAQIDAQKAQADFALRARDMAAKDDLARDKMAQDLALEQARIAGEYAIRVDDQAIKREQAAARPAPGGSQ